ncbi:hypothetical protein LG943_04855 [Streptomonospora sp. S1-112]|uniref:Uncharacterized protein n=1 Tax=Streptomonospora mangrovi TaxID=2883123 RepID=A0A9X3NI85_9ACTN|nr:hypothetical protein [Streptomonospora mangrovi]MDA0563663.1 hypothetical protein [Streptomonospora mangrovi]
MSLFELTVAMLGSMAAMVGVSEILAHRLTRKYTDHATHENRLDRVTDTLLKIFGLNSKNWYKDVNKFLVLNQLLKGKDAFNDANRLLPVRHEQYLEFNAVVEHLRSVGLADKSLDEMLSSDSPIEIRSREKRPWRRAHESLSAEHAATLSKDLETFRAQVNDLGERVLLWETVARQLTDRAAPLEKAHTLGLSTIKRNEMTNYDSTMRAIHAGYARTPEEVAANVGMTTELLIAKTLSDIAEGKGLGYIRKFTMRKEIRKAREFDARVRSTKGLPYDKHHGPHL